MRIDTAACCKYSTRVPYYLLLTRTISLYTTEVQNTSSNNLAKKNMTFTVHGTCHRAIIFANNWRLRNYPIIDHELIKEGMRPPPTPLRDNLDRLSLK